MVVLLCIHTRCHVIYGRCRGEPGQRSHNHLPRPAQSIPDVRRMPYFTYFDITRVVGSRLLENKARSLSYEREQRGSRGCISRYRRLVKARSPPCNPRKRTSCSPPLMMSPMENPSQGEGCWRNCAVVPVYVTGYWALRVLCCLCYSWDGSGALPRRNHSRHARSCTV